MMFKASFGAVVLLTSMVSFASAQQHWGAGAHASAPREPVRVAPSPHDAVITPAHIARLRAALRLTPAQQQHWAPVEAALSDLARQQARGQAAGFTYRLADTSSAVAATAAQLRRIKAIAMPLIRTLDDNQKREAIAFARHVGFEQLIASF